MKLKFDKTDSTFGVPVGGGVLSPGRVSGAPGLKFRTQFAKGGSVSKRADGCVQKGKTRGKIV